MSECSKAGGSDRENKDGHLPSLAVPQIFSVCERKTLIEKKRYEREIDCTVNENTKVITIFLLTLFFKNQFCSSICVYICY